MAEVTAAMVKALRDQTGAGMMDCKSALTETAGDIEVAVDWLRKKGLAKAAKKAGRVAAEGLVGVATVVEGAGARGAVVEINSETDFVARNEAFQSFVSEVAKIALSVGGDTQKTASAKFPGTGNPVSDEVTNLVAKIGENLAFRRAAGVAVETGVVAAYVHNQTAPGLGKVGVLVALESAGDKEKLETLGRQLAMHIAATKPLALTETELDSALLDRERAIHAEKAAQSGKPEAVIQKMVEGGMRKYYEEVVLLHQLFVIDGQTRVSKVLEQAAKDVGAPVTLKAYQRFALGEGIEKETSDFAAEVAKAAGSN